MKSRPSLAVFWVSIDRIKPNPLQPRHKFNDTTLEGLATSIRQYGILQPLVVTKHDTINEVGNIQAQYELIAGERRLRAAKLADLSEVPVIIHSDKEQAQMKLELAVIENLQREDLNPIDRAQAFQRLVKEFSMKQSEVAKRVGKSREYIANSIRLLSLPEHMITAINEGKVSEGHARPLLMLCDTPEEQETLFNDITLRQLTVREAERFARKIAIHKVRKHSRELSPKIMALEEQIGNSLEAIVCIEKRGQVGGRITIEFNDEEDLQKISQRMSGKTTIDITSKHVDSIDNPIQKKDNDLYNFKNFSL